MALNSIASINYIERYQQDKLVLIFKQVELQIS